MRKDILPDSELFDGIDRDLFPEYDKAVELIIEGKPNRLGKIPDQRKNERFFKRLSKGPVYAGTWGTVLWGLPFFLMMAWIYFTSLEEDLGLLLLLFGLSLLGGFLFGCTMWYLFVKFTKKYLLEYTADYMQTQSRPPSVAVAHQIHETSDNYDDKYSQLDKIAKLKERGVLTEREFEKEKHKILNK